MAGPPSKAQARLFAQLLAELEPQFRRAFMASVTDLQANVNWKLLLDRLEAFDTEGAIAALNISPAAWAEYSSVMTAAYAKAGASTMAQIIQSGVAPVGTRFDMSNPRAQEWIRNNVAESVTLFTNEQITSARRVIQEGYSRGEGPRNIAIDLAGRVDGGSRQGGIIGLDTQRAASYEKVTQGMRTKEGVQSLVVKNRDGKLAVRYKVNPATAARIIKAYRNETAVSGDDYLISERQYKNALLKSRADTVSETETGNAVMSSRAESWEQAAESQGLNAANVIKTWRHRRGTSEFFRPDHLAMSGTSVRGLRTPFIFADGARLEFAHDPNGGARHVIRCGCSTEFRLERIVR